MKLIPVLLLVLAGAMRAGATTRFVWTNSPSETPPYTNGWNTAAHTIQAALDVSVNGDEVLVTNGFYSSGGAYLSAYGVTNRVAITNGVTVRSVNGASVTTIKGQFDPFTGGAGSNAIRCVLVQQVAGKLVGFTLAGGATALAPYDIRALSGGGLFMHNGTVSNCVITGNKATGSGGGAIIYSSGILSHSMIVSNLAYSTNSLSGTNVVTTFPLGGGVYMSAGELRNCLVIHNKSESEGGGVYMSVGQMDACTVSDNTATDQYHTGFAGGVDVNNSADVLNTIVVGNHADTDMEYSAPTGAFSFCCTTPLPSGPGNFDADPEFLGNGNYHIGVSSPCINAGTNHAWMFNGVDLDNEPRRRNGLVDVGADEAVDFAAVDISITTNVPAILWETPSNDTYRLQFRTNPITGVWSNLGVVSSTTGFVTTVDTNPFHPYRLYRLITN